MRSQMVKDYFEATLPAWEAIYRRDTLFALIYGERLRTALRSVDELRLAAGSAALDVGCGPGLGAAELARRGFDVDAIDTSARMIEVTRARARREGVEVRGSVADVHALAFADGAFDLVFVVGVSEWLPSLDGPLAEIARVLKPGGHLVLTADNSWALTCFIDPLQHPLVTPWKRALGRALRRLWPARRPLRTYPRSRRTLERALLRAGLPLRSAATLGFGPLTLFNRSFLPDRWGHALHHRLAALAERSSLRGAGRTHVLVAQRAPRVARPTGAARG
jgi:SAM-dependent methyltransferase